MILRECLFEYCFGKLIGRGKAGLVPARILGLLDLIAGSFARIKML